MVGRAIARCSDHLIVLRCAMRYAMLTAHRTSSASATARYPLRDCMKGLQDPTVPPSVHPATHHTARRNYANTISYHMRIRIIHYTCTCCASNLLVVWSE